MTRVYLDYNATAPLHPEVAGVMQECLKTPLNASSIHAEGRQARAMLESSRRVIAEAIGAFPAEIIFTASGTESNHWVLQVFGHKKFFISAIEHSSILAAPDAVRLPVDGQGVVDIAQMEALLPKEPGFMVSVMLANNETGVIQPIEEIAELVHARGGLLHCDGAQGLGKIPVDMSTLRCDLLTLCAHKMGGPVGAAALVAAGHIALPAIMKGGGQELNRRAGTENVAAIAGFAEAVRRIDLSHMNNLRTWLDAFEQQVLAHGGAVMSAGAKRLPNTSCVAMGNLSSQMQLMRLDLAGISVSAGAACTSGKVGKSHVLEAMNVDAGIAARAIRISGGWNTTQQDIAMLSEQWRAIAAS